MVTDFSYGRKSNIFFKKQDGHLLLGREPWDPCAGVGVSVLYLVTSKEGFGGVGGDGVWAET